MPTPMPITPCGGARTSVQGVEYMVSTKLYILNEGNEPSFLNVRRWQVIDLTQGSTLVGNLVSYWHASSEESLSDHRYIYFKI